MRRSLRYSRAASKSNDGNIARDRSSSSAPPLYSKNMRQSAMDRSRPVTRASSRPDSTWKSNARAPAAAAESRNDTSHHQTPRPSARVSRSNRRFETLDSLPHGIPGRSDMRQRHLLEVSEARCNGLPSRWPMPPHKLPWSTAAPDPGVLADRACSEGSGFGLSCRSGPEAPPA
jgi:hypothetical protein